MADTPTFRPIPQRDDVWILGAGKYRGQHATVVEVDYGDYVAVRVADVPEPFRVRDASLAERVVDGRVVREQRARAAVERQVAASNAAEQRRRRDRAARPDVYRFIDWLQQHGYVVLPAYDGLFDSAIAANTAIRAANQWTAADAAEQSAIAAEDAADAAE